MRDSQPKIGVLEQEPQRRQDLAGRGELDRRDPLRRARDARDADTRAIIGARLRGRHELAEQIELAAERDASSARGPAVPTAERKTRSHDDGTPRRTTAALEAMRARGHRRPGLGQVEPLRRSRLSSLRRACARRAKGVAVPLPLLPVLAGTAGVTALGAAVGPKPPAVHTLSGSTNRKSCWAGATALSRSHRET